MLYGVLCPPIPIWGHPVLLGLVLELRPGPRWALIPLTDASNTLPCYALTSSHPTLRFHSNRPHPSAKGNSRFLLWRESLIRAHGRARVPGIRRFVWKGHHISLSASRHVTWRVTWRDVIQKCDKLVAKLSLWLCSPFHIMDMCCISYIGPGNVKFTCR